MSWATRALAARRVWTQPARVSSATCPAAPPHAMAGPPTRRTDLPAAPGGETPGQVPGRAGMHEGGPGDQQDFLAGRPRGPDRVGDGAQADGLGLLAGDVRAHEAERADAAGPLGRHDAHAVVADDEG